MVYNIVFRDAIFRPAKVKKKQTTTNGKRRTLCIQIFSSSYIILPKFWSTGTGGSFRHSAGLRKPVPLEKTRAANWGRCHVSAGVAFFSCVFWWASHLSLHCTGVQVEYVSPRNGLNNGWLYFCGLLKIVWPTFFSVLFFAKIWQIVVNEQRFTNLVLLNKIEVSQKSTNIISRLYGGKEVKRLKVCNSKTKFLLLLSQF